MNPELSVLALIVLGLVVAGSVASVGVSWRIAGGAASRGRVALTGVLPMLGMLVGFAVWFFGGPGFTGSQSTPWLAFVAVVGGWVGLAWLYSLREVRRGVLVSAFNARRTGGILVAVALVILLGLIAVSVLQATINPTIVLLAVVSAVPAALAVIVRPKLPDRPA